jgi:hypothetical protein
MISLISVPILFSHPKTKSSKWLFPFMCLYHNHVCVSPTPPRDTGHVHLTVRDLTSSTVFIVRIKYYEAPQVPFPQVPYCITFLRPINLPRHTTSYTLSTLLRTPSAHYFVHPQHTTSYTLSTLLSTPSAHYFVHPQHTTS